MKAFLIFLIITSMDGGIAVQAVDHPPQVFFQIVFNSKNFAGAKSVYAIDMDKDTDKDLIGVADIYTKVSWFENDGYDHFTEHIAADFIYVEDVAGEDLDGDGDVDLTVAIYGLYPTYIGYISIWENDGSQNFSRRDIDSEMRGARVVRISDIDQDGDPDVLGGAWYWDQVAWYENVGPMTFVKHIIDEWFIGCVDLKVVDLDRDGDPDIIGAAERDNAIAWYDNDGNQVFTRHDIHTDCGEPRSISACDLDGDSDLDLVSGSFEANKINWWENDGHQNFTRHLIEHVLNATYVDGYDMDQDGDNDVVGVSASPDDDNLMWYENIGDGVFKKWVIKSNFNSSPYFCLEDWDEDGNMDILYSQIGHEISLWKNRPNLAVNLSMPAHEFHPGDTCRLEAEIVNYSYQTLEDVPLCIVLDIYGQFYFGPSWSQAFDCYQIDTSPGSQTKAIFEPFAWPEDSGEASGLHFYGCLLESDFSDLLGSYSYWEFGWSEL